METFDLTLTIPLPTWSTLFDLTLIYFLVGNYVLIGVTCRYHIGKARTFKSYKPISEIAKLYFFGSFVWPYIVYLWAKDELD